MNNNYQGLSVNAKTQPKGTKTVPWEMVVHNDLSRKNKNGVFEEGPEIDYLIVKSFYESDLYNLVKLHQKKNGMPWYKFLNYKFVIKNVNPIQTHILNLILDAKLKNAFKDMTLTKNEFLDLEFVEEVYKHLLLYGDIIVLFDYIWSEREKKLVLKREIIDDVRTFEYIKNEQNNIEYFNWKIHYTINGESYILLREFIDNLEKKTLIKEETGEIVSLSLLDPKIKEVVKYKVKPFFKFHSDKNAKHKISILNEIDANKTQISYINKIGQPFRIDPELLRKKPGGGSVDDSDLNEFQAQLMEGAVKPSFIQQEDGTVQVVNPDFVNPELSINTYQESINDLVKDVSRFFGVSPVTAGYAPYISNVSGDALKEVNQMTRINLEADRRWIINMVETILTQFGVKYEIDINDNEGMPSADSIIKMATVVAKYGLLSDEDFDKYVYPYHTPKQRARRELEKTMSQIKGNTVG